MNKKQTNLFVKGIGDRIIDCKNKTKQLLAKYNENLGDITLPASFSFLHEVFAGFKNNDFDSIFDEYLAKNNITDNNIESKLGIASIKDLKKEVNKCFLDENIYKNETVFEIARYVKNRMNDNEDIIEYPLIDLLTLINSNRTKLGLNKVIADNGNLLKDYRIDEKVLLNLDNIDSKEDYEKLLKNLSELLKLKIEYVDGDKAVVSDGAIKLPKKFDETTVNNQGPLLNVSKILYELAINDVEPDEILKNKIGLDCVEQFNNSLNNLSKTEKVDIMASIESIASLFVALNMEIALLELEQTKQLVKLFEYNIANKLVSLTSKLEEKDIASTAVSYLLTVMVNDSTKNLFAKFNLSQEYLTKKYSALGTLTLLSNDSFAIALNQYNISKDQIEDAILVNFDYKKLQDDEKYKQCYNEYTQKINKFINYIEKGEGLELDEKEAKKQIIDILADIKQLKALLESHTKVYAQDYNMILSRHAFASVVEQNIEEIKDVYDETNTDIEDAEHGLVSENTARPDPEEFIETPSEDNNLPSIDETILGSEGPVTSEEIQQVAENNDAIALRLAEYERKIAEQERIIREQEEKMHLIQSHQNGNSLIIEERVKELKPQVMSVVDDTVKKVSNDLTKLKYKEEALSKMVFSFNFLLNSDETNLQTMNYIATMHNPNIFNMMVKLKNGLKNLNNKTSDEIARYIVSLSLNATQNQNMKSLVNAAMAQMNLKIITDLEVKRENELKQAELKYKDDFYSYQKEMDRIKTLYDGNGEKIGLITQAKNNLLAITLKNIVLDEIVQIYVCNSNNSKYEFSLNSIDAMMKKVFKKQSAPENTSERTNI